MTSLPDLRPLLPDDATLDARRHALVESLRTPSATTARRAPKRARTRVGVALAAVMLIGSGVAGASALLQSDQVDVFAGIGCYEGPALDADTAVIGPQRDPIAACATLWRNGDMDNSLRPRADASDLVACSGKDRPVFVFPTRDPGLCERLGLAPLPSDFATAGEKAQRVERTLADLLSGEYPCTEPSATAAEARRRLAANDLADVTVTVQAGGPCSVVIVEGHAVNIYPDDPADGEETATQVPG